MGVITEFGQAAASLVKAGSSINRTQRQEIRDAVGQLGDELDRALQLAEAYLAGGKGLRDPAELSQYLRNMRATLLGSYHEYKVCAGLYALGDRLDAVFDATRFALKAGSIQGMRQLVDTLARGERTVLDDIGDTIDRTDTLADAVMNAPAGEEENVRREVTTSLTIEIEKLRNHRRTVKTITRELFRNM